MLHTFWIYSELANTKPGITSLSTKTKQKHCLVGPRRVIRQVGNVRSHSSIPGRFMLTALCHLHCYGKVRLFYAAFLSLLSLLVMFNLSLGLVLLPLVKYFRVKPKRGIFSNPQLRRLLSPTSSSEMLTSRLHRPRPQPRRTQHCASASLTGTELSHPARELRLLCCLGWWTGRSHAVLGRETCPKDLQTNVTLTGELTPSKKQEKKICS